MVGDTLNGIRRDRIAMCGDMLHTDILGAAAPSMVLQPTSVACVYQHADPHWEYHRRISVACERHRPNMCLKPEELCATALPHSAPCNKSVSSSVSIAVNMVRKSCKFSSTILILGCLCSGFILTRYTMSICGNGRMIISTSSTAL